MNLSKSRYCMGGVQCPKILWLDKNKPEAKALDQNTSKFEQGNIVGNLAMQHFGKFTEVSFDSDKNKMISQTNELLKRENVVIAEASFAHNGNFCSVDLLRKTGNIVEIVEVKSSTNHNHKLSPPKEIAPIYQEDMAFQYYVVSHSGLSIKSGSLLQLNKHCEPCR